MGSENQNNVKVVVRCRPLAQTEIKKGFKSVVTVEEESGRVLVKNPDAVAGEPPKSFTFDHSFAPNSNQLDVYNRAARPIVDNILEGYNGTIFAYGQTGTGKTFTMEGDRSLPEKRGIIPNSFAHIFGHVCKSTDSKTFLVRVSYMEIYNEEVRDLIGKDQNAKLEIKERPDVGVYVKDLSTVTVSSADDMDKIMSLGNKNRKVGSTDMNERSSRSHAIFTVTVECSEIGPDKQSHVRVGKLHLVDLAGSERQSKTGAKGDRLKEGIKINLSLSTLGNVISALTDKKATHVPYRNSKLTRLLQDSLGGNSKTVMIANFGPANYNYDESISTLRYANRAKSIQNAAKINEDPKDALLRKFQQEIMELKKQLEEGGGEGGDGESEGDGEEEDDPAADPSADPTLSEEKMEELEKKIEEDRRALTEKMDMEEGERERLAMELKKREEDLNLARNEHLLLKKKLAQMEKKMIVGGENLLEKAEEQARLLDESNRELEERREKEFKLREALQLKQAERIDMEEKYSTLQEEANGKTKKLKKVYTMLMSAKAEMRDLEGEHQREMEGLLDNVRQLSRELRLQMLIINSFIPPNYQEMIERYVEWNEEMGEWELECVAYTGNNMRKHNNQIHHYAPVSPPDLSSVYLSYDEEGATTNLASSQSDLSKKLKAQKRAKKDKKAAQLKTLLT